MRSSTRNICASLFIVGWLAAWDQPPLPVMSTGARTTLRPPHGTHEVHIGDGDDSHHRLADVPTTGIAGSPAQQQTTVYSTSNPQVRFIQRATSESHTCGLTSLGQACCWGRNDAGQLGDGTTIDRHTPTVVSGGRAYSTLSTGGFHTCDITTNDTYCWAWNLFGQLADGTIVDRHEPTVSLAP